MKLSGILGTGTGKLGSSVFSVNSGEQVVRQYQGNVSNPSTESQVGQRSKMKLMSQLAAVFATVIAIPKSGMQSSRNLFIAKNIGLCTESDGVASINLAGVQITNSSRGFAAITVSRGTNNSLEVALAEDVTKIANHVVYAAFKRNADGTIQLIDSAVVSAPGTGGTYPTTLAGSADEVIVYAYGIKDADSAATGKFENYNVATGSDVASLVASRSISAAQYAFTRTSGILLAAQA